MFDRVRRLLGLCAVLLIMIIFWGGADISAQSLPRPELTISGNLVPNTAFDNPPLNDFNTYSSRVQAVDFAAELSYPIVLNYGQTIWFVAGSYSQKLLDYNNWPENISTETDRLHQISLSVALYRMVSQSWSLLVYLEPQIASTLSRDFLTFEDLSLQAAVIMEKIFNQHWTVGFGAAYSSTFGKPIPIPLLTFRYDSGRRWYAQGNLPADISVWYRAGNSTDLGFFLRADGNQYHTPGIYPADMNIDNPQLEYVRLSIGPSVHLRLNSTLRMELDGGIAYQHVQLMDDGEKLPNSEYELKINGFAKAALTLSF